MNNFATYYKKLNKDQKIAVDILEGPLLILAGPGTGKTELLSVRAANIIVEKKARPENMLILTYTNAAAKAMKERLVKILGPSGYDIETGTFHSFANSIILESDEAANYIQEKIQITDIEKVKALEYILDHTKGIDAIRPFRAPYVYRSQIERKISELKKEGITPKSFEASMADLKPDSVYIEDKHLARLKALARVYKLYEEYKNGKNKDLFDERGRYDFDDMILFALEALKKEKELKSLLQSQYTYIMVDEYQDTNGAQMEMLFELINSKNPNICCVGDDDQSIYRFQGASVGNFKILQKAFPEMKTVSLKDNYRSTKEILGLTDKLIQQLPDKERMETKELIAKRDYASKKIEFHELTTQAEELLFITEKVNEAKSIIESDTKLTPEERQNPYNNIAVLVRKRDDILKLVDAFLEAGIPYATDGKEDISSEKRVRQMIDLLSLAHPRDPSDISEKDSLFYRVLTSDYFNIPLSDILNFIAYVHSKKRKARARGESLSITLFSEFLSAFKVEDDKTPPARKDAMVPKAMKLKLEDPYSMLFAGWAIARLLKDAQTRPVHAILMQYIEDAGVFRHILSSYADDSILRIRDLRSLSSFVQMVKDSDMNNPAIRLSDFLDEIETRKEHGIPLAGELVTMTQEGVRIYTAHGSKGLEFYTVIIPFCLQNKNWPIRPRGDSLPLPPEIFKTKERVADKLKIKELSFFDETRLFYVASTRAKSHLIYTASPTDKAISSSYLASIDLSSEGSESQAEEEPLLARALKTTHKEDPFVGTESILKDMISSLSLNPTSLNNYINCKRKFLYDNVLRLPSQKKRSLIFGTCVHKALEDTYRSFMEKGRYPDFDFFKKAFKDELKYEGVERSIKEHCLRQLDTLSRWFEKDATTPIKPVGLEKKLSIMIEDDLVFTGKYDKTEMQDAKSKLVRVMDYKTGKPDIHIKNIGSKQKALSGDECDGYLRQLVAYKLLFDRDKDQNKGFRVSHGVLVFVEPANSTVLKYGLKKGDFINKEVEITDGMVLELEKVIRDCWRSIKSLDFEKLPEEDDDIKKCGGCDYKNMCWG